MDTIVFYDLGWNVSLEVPKEATDDEREKLKKKFVHSYTFGIEPGELFHSSIDFLKDPFDEGIRDPFWTLEPKHMKLDQRVTITAWRKYLKAINPTECEEALERLSEWIEGYYVFRKSNDDWNISPIPAGSGKQIMTYLREWIEDQLLKSRKHLKITAKPIHTKVSISTEVLTILQNQFDNETHPIIENIKIDKKDITQSEIIRYYLKSIGQEERYKSIASTVSKMKNRPKHERDNAKKDKSN